jgi:lipoprotein NlpI
MGEFSRAVKGRNLLILCNIYNYVYWKTSLMHLTWLYQNQSDLRTCDEVSVDDLKSSGYLVCVVALK